MLFYRQFPTTLLFLFLFALPTFKTAVAGEYKWWHKMIGVTEKKQIKMGQGSGVRVGVLDTWANFNHAEFSGRLDHSWLYTSGIYTHFDDHGTHVSGIIGAGRNGFGMVGIAPGVRISNVAVFDDNGFFRDGDGTAIGLARVYADGATIANMSYGAFSIGVWLTDLTAISSFSDKLVVTKSAGNEGAKLGSLGSAIFDSSLENLIVVGAVDKRKKITKFSNRPGSGCFLDSAGICTKGNRYKDRFLVAPGDKIHSTTADGSYEKFSGTSMAAPIVAGAAALLQSRWAFLKNDPALTTKILFKTAEDLGKKGVDNKYGRGLLRVDRAMKAYKKTWFAAGTTVTSQKLSTTSSSMGLSPAFGAGSGVTKALDGLVMFDSFGRDFKVDPKSLVRTQSAGLSLQRRIENRFNMAERGSLVRLQLTDQMSFSGAGLGAAETLSGAEFNDPLSGYLDYMNDERPVWRFDGDFDSASFSFGQSADMLREITMGSPQQLFLLDSEVSSQPVTVLGEQSAFGFGRYKLSDSLSVGVGFAQTNVETDSAQSSGSGEAFLIQTDFKPTEGLGLQFTQTFLSEDDTMLGSVSGGGLAFGSGAQTVSSGASVSYTIDKETTARFHFTAATTETEASTEPTSMFRNVSAVRSRSYGLSLMHKGVFGTQDEIGLSVSKPFLAHAGEATIKMAVGRTVDGKVIYEQRTFSLAPEGSQTDFDVGYRTALTDGLSFGVNTFYQNELNHDPDQFNAGVWSQFRLIY